MYLFLKILIKCDYYSYGKAHLSPVLLPPMHYLLTTEQTHQKNKSDDVNATPSLIKYSPIAPSNLQNELHCSQGNKRAIHETCLSYLISHHNAFKLFLSAIELSWALCISVNGLSSSASRPLRLNFSLLSLSSPNLLYFTHFYLSEPTQIWLLPRIFPHLPNQSQMHSTQWYFY